MILAFGLRTNAVSLCPKLDHLMSADDTVCTLPPLLHNISWSNVDGMGVTNDFSAALLQN